MKTAKDSLAEVKVKHTPTPWGMALEKDGSTRVYELHEWSKTYPNDSHIVGESVDEADAAFIIKACNAHDELLSALHLARRIITNNVPEYLVEAWNANRDRHLAQIDAALAKAEGR